jgi:hypothetical protein
MKKDEIKCYIDGKKVNIEKCDGKETFAESFFNDKKIKTEKDYYESYTTGRGSDA